jgi:hypothetical protein
MDEDDSYNDEVHPVKLGKGTDSDTTFEQSILKTLKLEQILMSSFGI